MFLLLPPGMCHTHYSSIVPIVRDTAKEFGIPYVDYPTFWSAVKAHFDHLTVVGSLRPAAAAAVMPAK